MSALYIETQIQSVDFVEQQIQWSVTLGTYGHRWSSGLITTSYDPMVDNPEDVVKTEAQRWVDALNGREEDGTATH